MVSLLEVGIEDIGNCKILKVVDNSIYNPSVPIENCILEITVPGYDCPVVFNVQPYFILLLDSVLLEIQPNSPYTQRTPLPEGVYHIKYSINPNSSLYVEYDYLRNCQQLKFYEESVCALLDKRCNGCGDEFKDGMKKLLWMGELIKASKYKVEDMDEADEGLLLYNEVRDLLKEMNYCKC